MNYTVYKHICPNNKVYIGITVKKPEVRWNKGLGYKKQDYFYKAILKYGWDNIKHEILYKNLSKEEAENIEIKLIKEYKSNIREFGYNISNGGNTVGTHAESTKLKLSEAKKGCKNPMYKVPSPMTGKTHSEEAKKKISEKLKGNKHALGMKHSEDAKRRMGETKRENGFKPWITGRGHSEATKEKLREANAFRKKKVLCISTGVVYDSIKKASEHTGANKKSIGYCCNGKYKHSGGYEWKFYLEDK